MLDATHLFLQKSPGYYLYYSNEPLAIENVSTDTFSIYPNPVLNFLNVSTNNLPIEKISVYSISGKKIFEKENDVKIDVFKLSKGIYFIEIYSNQQKIVKKFIKI